MFTTLNPEEPAPLHAYEVTPEIANALRVMQGVVFMPTAHIYLPGGKLVTGEELNRWIGA